MAPRHLDLAPPAATSPPPLPDDAACADELALPDDAGFDATGLVLYLVATVRFEAARLVEHDAGDTSFVRGDQVLCDTADGPMPAEVVVPSRRVLRAAAPPRILRRATPADTASLAELRRREQEVLRAASVAARSLGLPVKVVRAEAAAGGARFVVQFASDAKVPFRDWLRAVGRESRERVELRQVGMRDAARLIGGVGPCGLQLCCNTFLSDFTPVAMKMAKTQGLATNPQKVSGVCGRLLCCLVYEEAHYRAAREAMPEPGDSVETPRGKGTVTGVDVLPMQVEVALDGGETARFAAAEVTRLARGPRANH